MKKLLFVVLVLLASNAMGLGITSIQGPRPIINCQNATETYIANYELLYLSASNFHFVTKVKWEFIQNNSIVRTLYSSDFTKMGFEGSAKITVSNLPLGNVTIRVTLSIDWFNFSFPINPTPLTMDKEKNIIVLGISAPTTITSASNICPGSSTNFSIAPVTNAASYTWQVPSGWLVNGIIGPVVTGQGNSVSITAPHCSDPQVRIGSATSTCAPYDAIIKVKAVSSICGESSYRPKSITVDYPVSVSNYLTFDNTVVFTASPTNFPYYNWSISDDWTLVSNNNASIELNHNNQRGNASLTVRTFCNNYYTVYSSFNPSDPGIPASSVYPNPATSELMITTSPNEAELSSLSIEENGVFQSFEASKNNGVYKIDISELKPGLHILKTKNSKGEEQFIRFLKSK